MRSASLLKGESIHPWHWFKTLFLWQNAADCSSLRSDLPSEGLNDELFSSFHIARRGRLSGGLGLRRHTEITALTGESSGSETSGDGESGRPGIQGAFRFFGEAPGLASLAGASGNRGVFGAIRKRGIAIAFGPVV